MVQPLLGLRTKLCDEPFFANDGFEGSKKAGRRLATFKLHAGLDLENVQVSSTYFLLDCPSPPFRDPEAKKKSTDNIYGERTCEKIMVSI